MPSPRSIGSARKGRGGSDGAGGAENWNVVLASGGVPRANRRSMRAAITKERTPNPRRLASGEVSADLRPACLPGFWASLILPTLRRPVRRPASP